MARENIRLSSRERAILLLVATGLTDRQIAERLGISRKTVSNHVSVILQKLGARRRTDAAVRAVQAGLLSDKPQSSP